MNAKLRRAAGAIAVLLLIIAGYLQQVGAPGVQPNGSAEAPSQSSRGDSAVGGERIAPIDWSPQLAGRWVETGARVYRVLADDNDGSRHQRLLVRDANGYSLLIAHNIDLAPRVPVQVGDALLIRGQFEWNDKGGVIHWTHHDPQRRHAGGYIEKDGRRYR